MRRTRFAWIATACFMGACLGACSLGLDAKRLEWAASGMGYVQGHALAVWQDSLLDRYGRGEKIPERELDRLRGNPWVRSSQGLAPGNLVIRHWALVDLFAGNPHHAERILEMSRLLAGKVSPEGEAFDSPGALWLEGYSYWVYTRRALEPWSIRFAGREEAGQVRALMDAVDSCFAATAYDRDGVAYPAPFGDLRDLPLEEPALTWRAKRTQGPSSCAFAHVETSADTVRYRIDAHPVGLNTHVPPEPARVIVRAGRPEGFAFYEGYARKYADSTAEIKDMLRVERLRSIRALRLRERFGP